MAIAALKFFFETTLRQYHRLAWLHYPKVPRLLPTVLSGTEVQALFAALTSPTYRTMAMVLYGTGLRIAEACALHTDDVDGSRKLIHVRHGEGNKDRMVPLPESLLNALRVYWRQTRPPRHLLRPDLSDQRGCCRARALPLRQVVRQNDHDAIIAVVFLIALVIARGDGPPSVLGGVQPTSSVPGR